MGRHAKVPVEAEHGNKVVSKERVSWDSKTPYTPNDVRWDMLDRMGFSEIPSFEDE